MSIRSFGRAVLGAACATLAAAGLFVALPAPEAAAAPALRPNFVLKDTPSGQGPWEMTDFVYLPDDSVLTTGKNGRLAWVSKTGQPKTIANIPVNSDGDLGLVSVEVAPDYATSKHIYLVRSTPPVNGAFVARVERWTVTGGSEPTGITDPRTIFEIPGEYPTHALTGVVAAKDGTLWITNGDWATPGYADPRALDVLDPNKPEGKLFHVTNTGAGVPSNPFYDAANPNSVRSRTYAGGFRSPFRLTIDERSGLPVVGDVGWNDWEEINLVQPGQHYSWPCFEGNNPTPGYSTWGQCNGVVNNRPLWTYRHADGPIDGTSVTGGIIYNGTNYPAEYRGAYFFGDWEARKIWTLTYSPQGTLLQAPQSPFGTDIGGPVKFAAAPNGDVVYADNVGSALRRIVYAPGNAAPVAIATSTTDPATRTVTFDASESYDPEREDLTYRWDFGDGTTGTGVTASHRYAGSTPTFTAKLTVTDRENASATTELTVAPSNHTPKVTLAAAGQADYAVGDPVSVSATATDTEDGALPISWEMGVVHCQRAAACHTHKGSPGSGPTYHTTFTDHQDSSMEFIAKVTDSMGVTASATYVAKPREHRLTLKSNVPAALQIAGEGGVSSAMVAEKAPVDISAPPTASDGVSTFDSWSDGSREATRRITMPAADTTLTATYVTAIDKRYNAEPALRQLLGTATGPEVVDGGGRHKPYQNGRLYWSPNGGVRVVHGEILARYLEQGGAARFGPPVTDQLATPDGVGRYNHFAMGASVYWSPSTGANAIAGPIRAKWASMGWERSYLAYPSTSELSTPDGRGKYNNFSGANGAIYWTETTGAQSINGEVRALWSSLGSERSVLGYPVTSELSVSDNWGKYFNFENNGSIYWTPSTGARWLCCQNREKWFQLGGATGRLGYPTTNEAPTPDGIGRYSHFTKGGSVYWFTTTGSHEVYGEIRRRWAALGWERSYLGYPTSDEFSIPGGRRSNFQNGYITWMASNGAVTDRRY
ncbi:PQQ-dependent sugar dehydrogenase [Amycolatopsis suaedae]|uniref:PKD domain-containing protein n=1 Tax=Amycolatopsis suaedae TaxID=2510978 RepID=A0A4Q7J9B8_9PSEU|nr:PQQ-dependent sugar dehydrogenase [Amycolatopsis suaedae]RZQ64351.1 PKD domain-containing protein [Amycolatopsis suaedae]